MRLFSGDFFVKVNLKAAGSGEGLIVRAVQWAVKSDGCQGHRIGQPGHALRPLNLTLDRHGWYRRMLCVRVFRERRGLPKRQVPTDRRASADWVRPPFRACVITSAGWRYCWQSFAPRHGLLAYRACVTKAKPQADGLGARFTG